MYDNATEYEGNPIEAQTKLSKNQYSRIGYKFVGWNTKADGSGDSFTDEQEILNLTDKNKGVIVLYAQWQLCTNQLIIDANGGTYAGQAKAQYTVNYGGSQAVNKSQVTAPSGYTIAFDGNGGSVQGMNTTELSSINGSTGKTLKTVRDVSEWTLNFGNTNSYMEYSGVNGTFYNKVPDPYDHILTVQYSDNTFKLPSATKSGSVFVGWKLSTGTTGDTSIHTQGETVTPSMSMSNSGYITYIAQYAEMTATVTPNYEKNNMAGAADLKWGWNASLTKKVYYQIYRDGIQISNETGGSAVTQPGKVVDSTTSGTYTVLYTGFYNFEAAGAAGGSYSGHSGGKGAVVKGGIFLNKGDKLITKLQNMPVAHPVSQAQEPVVQQPLLPSQEPTEQ